MVARLDEGLSPPLVAFLRGLLAGEGGIVALPDVVGEEELGACRSFLEPLVKKNKPATFLTDRVAKALTVRR